MSTHLFGRAAGWLAGHWRFAIAPRISKALQISQRPGEYLQRRRLGRQTSAPLERVRDSLELHGYAILDEQEQESLDLHAELLEATRERLRRDMATGPLPFNKKCQANLTDDFERDCAPDSIFVRFGLQPRILSTVAAYLGCAPRLEMIKVLYSVARNGDPEHSELWHVDRGDVRNVKVFVYAEDVGERNGPLTILSGPDSRRARGHFLHQGRVSEEEMAAVVPRSDWVALKAQAGTVAVRRQAAGFVTEAPVIDIGTPERYQDAQSLLPGSP